MKVVYGYQDALENMKRGLQTAEDRMAKAATKTMREAAKLVEQRGRAAIAAGGLSPRFQRAFFVRAKPRVGYSLKTSMRGYHRIGFANIFEHGGTISPKSKPLLWIPLSSAPQKIGRKRMTPRLYIEQIGPLHYIRRPGKPPLLAGDTLKTGRSSVASLKSGARNANARKEGGKGRRTVSVPIFVGIKQTKISRRLNVDAVYKAVAREVPRLYAEQIQQIMGSA